MKLEIIEKSLDRVTFPKITQFGLIFFKKRIGNVSHFHRFFWHPARQNAWQEGIILIGLQNVK